MRHTKVRTASPHVNELQSIVVTVVDGGSGGGLHCLVLLLLLLSTGGQLSTAPGIVPEVAGDPSGFVVVVIVVTHFVRCDSSSIHHGIVDEDGVGRGLGQGLQVVGSSLRGLQHVVLVLVVV